MERWVWGVGVWVGLVLPGVVVGWLGVEEPRSVGAWLAASAVLAAAVGVRRARPLLAFLAAAALGLVTAPSLFTLSHGPALALFALLLGRRAPRTGPALLAFAGVAVVGTVKIAVRDVDPVVEWLVLVGTLVFGAVFPWLGGRYWRQGRELAAAGWARAEQLEREQRIVADRARLRERARIAQDTHDSLGHELSLIAVRAGALQVAPDLADRHRAAAADLRAAASQATDRLHAIIGLLREDDDERAPLAPTGESTADLVARAAESGLDITYDDDAPARPTDPAVHRVVQEALTNAARHAPGAPVTVTVRRGEDATTVTVVNGRPRQPARPSEGGTGLRGLRARVTDLGGTFDAGPHADGFRVAARLPVAGSAPAPPPHSGARLASARRRTVLAFGGAVTAGVLLVGGAFAWYAYSRTHSVLDPADYARLRVGAPRAAVESVLPDRAASDPPVERAPGPPPDGADCAYYRASGELFTAVPYFRICFGGDGGRLVDKTVIPTADG